MGCDTASVGYREPGTFIKTTRARRHVARGQEALAGCFEIGLSCASCAIGCCRRVARLVGRDAAASRRVASPPAPPDAGAAEPPELESLVAGASSCPRPDLVLAELATLLPPDRLGARLRALPGTPAVVELVDLGVPFQVIVAGRVREYRDEARDCVHRARVAAVFVALTIDPASLPRRRRRRSRRRRPPRSSRPMPAPVTPPARARRRGRRPRRGRRLRRSRRPGRRRPAPDDRPRAAGVRRGRDRALARGHERGRRAACTSGGCRSTRAFA